MTSLTRFSFAAPTTPPLGLYTPHSAGGLTGMVPPQPRLLTTVGKIILHRVLSLTTTASTSSFKWLSLGNLSRRRLNLHPTPTSAYCLEPTTPFIAPGKINLALIAILSLIFFFSVLFGAGVVFGRRGGWSSSSLFTGYRQKKARNGNHSPRSLYSESSTLFHQDDTVLLLRSYMPRLSYFWISALRFGLRGLAFLFRLVCMEQLLDMVEDNNAEQRAAISAVDHIAELRALNKKLRDTLNITAPTQTVVSSARLHDANETLVAPFLPVHAKSKPGQDFLPSSDHDKVDVILPEDVKRRPPTSVRIDFSTRKVSVSTPPVEDVRGAIADNLGLVHGGTTSEGGEGSLPTSYRRSSSRIRHDEVLAPSSVEPPGVPDMPSSSVYKSFHMPFRPIHLTIGDRPSIPFRNNAPVSPSVEPPSVPDRVVEAFEPHAESSAQAEARCTRCFGDSPQQPRSPIPSTSTLNVAAKPHPVSVYQTEVRRLFQLCFDDLSNYSKPTALTPTVRALETDTRKLTSADKQEECPKTSPQKDVSAVPCTPENVGLASTSGTEKIPPRLLTSTSQTNSLSSRSSAVAEANRSPFDSVEALRENARKVVKGAREATAAFDLRMHTKHSGQFSSAGTENHVEPLEVRENARRVIQSSQEVAAALEMRIRTRYPALESHPGEQPQRPKAKSTDTGLQPEETTRDITEQMRRRHEDLIARVRSTLNRRDDERELRVNRSQAVTQNSDRLPSKLGPEESQQEVASTFQPMAHPDLIARLHSLLELDVAVSDDGTANTIEPASSERYVLPPPLEESCLVESSWRIEDHIPEATDDETGYDGDSLEDIDSDGQEQTPPSIISDSESSRSCSHAPPLKIQDLFYSLASSTHPARSTNLMKTDKLTGFGSGSPCGRRIQRLDPRDTFYTSTPRVNYAHFGGFGTSTPRSDVDHRKDTWADFF